jgi:type II secretion system protein J
MNLIQSESRTNRSTELPDGKNVAPRAKEPPKMRRNPSHAQHAARGFTIMELVVAISVSAIVVVTISTVLSRIGRARDVTRTRLDAVTRATAAMDSLRRDLSSIVRSADLFDTRLVLLDGQNYSDYGPMDRDEVLIYNTRLRPMQRDEYQGEGGEYESQYRVMDDSDGSVLWMRRDAVPDENGEGGGIAMPSVDGIVGVSIEAYDGESWYPDWDSDELGLPWALRITVTATGDMPGGEVSEPGKALAVLRTQVPIDRIVPPPPPPEEDESGLDDGTGANGEEGDAQGGANGTDGGTDGGTGGGVNGGGGRGDDLGVDGGGRPGGGRPGGGRPGNGRPGGGRPGGGRPNAEVGGDNSGSSRPFGNSGNRPGGGFSMSRGSRR